VPLSGLRLGEAAVKGLLASGIMALIVSGIATLLGQWSPLIQVSIAGSAGVLVYALLTLILRIEAATFLFQIIRGRLRRSGREGR